MLRLDPAFPVLWRSVTTMQFGIDAVVVVEDPAPWQGRLIRELERGLPEPALEPVAESFGAPEGAATEFARQLSPVLATALADLRIGLLVPERFPSTLAERVRAGLCTAGVEIQDAFRCDVPDDGFDRAMTVVVLAAHLLEPQRGGALMSRDLTHLPIVFTAGRVEIGPLVIPGTTACLACIAAHARDEDPEWPVLAAQLVGRTPPEVSESIALEAGIVTAALLREAAADRLPARVSLHERSLHRSQQVFPPHPACLCGALAPRLPQPAAPTSRSPARSATADDHETRSTTIPRAFARPA